MSLRQYQKKRDFNKTPEPKGAVSKENSRLFIIQKHAASHLHYDFRIELGGVLKSWAVPKGPCLDPQVKRLAMHVEDHPLAYGHFEGTIPKGQYGGGTVMLWDKGIWIPLDKDPYEAYKKGHLHFRLKAKKLNGEWHLVRFKDDKHWLLFKHDDKYAKNQNQYDILEENRSVLSQKSLDEIASHSSKVWNSQTLKKKPGSKKTALKKHKISLPKEAKKSPFPDFYPPQLATLVSKPPEGEQWLHEIKLDGYRILAFKQGQEVLLKSRNNKDWTHELILVARKILELPYENLVLDGEVVLLDKEGKSNFQLLQNAIKDEAKAPFVYYIFDILYFENSDLTELPLLTRKTILQQLLPEKDEVLHYSDHLLSEGGEIFSHSCNYALEGIISKRIDSPYLSKRTKNWLKIKCIKRQEFVIGGYSDPQGGRAHFGSLYLGIFNDNKEFLYTGNVGTGFTQKSLKEIYSHLNQMQSSKCPFQTRPPNSKKAHWLKPTLVCEVEFSEWTQEGHLRHPSFKGLRLDKKAHQVVREYETPIEEVKKMENKTAAETSKKITFAISNPKKILYPEDKISKEDLLKYYTKISDYILPYIKDRPLTLVRCPSEYQDCFYQRHYNESTSKGLYPVFSEEQDKEQYLYLKDKQGLFQLVQLGVLEIHPWGSRIQNLEQPDVIIIDLDPAPDVSWSEVVTASFDIKEHLNQLNLRSFVKSTGGKGLHVVIPIQPHYNWEEIKEFTHAFVELLEQIKPQQYISKMTKSKRPGKIFIDYLRNQRTATAIAPYSTRARLHAPVATPLAWEELSDEIQKNTYTIKSLPRRLARLKEDPWKDFWKIKQALDLDALKL